MRRLTAVLLCALFLFSGFVFAACAEPETDYAYPEPEVLEIDLYIQPYHYLQMISTTEKKKHPAVVSINGGEAREIGVQVRGTSSLKDGMSAANKRIPMELCFDDVDPNGTFRGNASLKLINCFSPARLLTQLIAMQTYAFLGIPTPRTTPAFLRINDVEYGLYLAVEDLNESFVRAHYGDVSLYRMPPGDGVGREMDPDLTFDGVQLSCKVDHGHETLRQYQQALTSGKDYLQYLDVDEFLRFLACDAFVCTSDGYFDSRRNFFILDNHGKLQILPWDRDDVFGQFPNEFSLQSYEDKNPHPLLQDEANFTRYRQYVRKLNDEFLDPDTFLPWLESTIRAVSPYLRADSAYASAADHILENLTTGDELYNTISGNLLLTFRLLHDQLDDQLSGAAEQCAVPEGKYVRDYDDGAEDVSFFREKDRSVIFRVCTNYWRLRRQFYIREYGEEGLLAGCLFAFVFAVTIRSACKPKGRKGKKRKNQTGEP